MTTKLNQPFEVRNGLVWKHACKNLCDVLNNRNRFNIYMKRPFLCNTHTNIFTIAHIILLCNHLLAGT